MTENGLRNDLKTIVSYIDGQVTILDLGCGDGTLLQYLQERGCAVRGIEKSYQKMNQALYKGIPVFLGDINRGLDLYEDQHFDYVVLSSTVQQLENPRETIEKMLKKGKKAIVSFTNYAYFINRLSFIRMGRKPINQVFQNDWYDTKDIHPLTINDFEFFCQKYNINIHQKTYLDGNWKKSISFMPNLLAGYAIYLISP